MAATDAYVLCRIRYWPALLVAPVLTAAIGFVVERFMIRRVYGPTRSTACLLTFGLAFIIQDVSRYIWGSRHCRSRCRMCCSSRSARTCSIALLPAVHGRRGDIAIAGLFAFLRYTSCVRIAAGTLDLDTVAVLRRERAPAALAQFPASASTLPGCRACWPGARSASTLNMGDDLLMPSSSPSSSAASAASPHADRRAADRRGPAVTTVFFRLPPKRDLRHHGGGAADPAARADGPGGDAHVKTAPALFRLLAIWRCCCWCPLAALPRRLHRTRWKGAGARLAAMALNLLLGSPG